VLAAGLVFVLVAGTLAAGGAATVARHRAQMAADLAALAAALRAWDGQSAACDRAADLSARNGASLVACRLEGLDAVVTVEVRVAGGVGWRAQASARAGPVE
jgi:secretion/DNA translocation related TadE-like protein